MWKLSNYLLEQSSSAGGFKSTRNNEQPRDKLHFVRIMMQETIDKDLSSSKVS